MKKYSGKFISLLAVISLVACASRKERAAEVAKTEKPASASGSGAGGSSLKLRPMKEVKLENGMKILFITDNSLPRISLMMLAKVGARQDPAGKEGLNALTAHLLEQGTQSRTAPVLADELGQLGTEVGIEPGNDFTLIAMDALVNSSDKLVSIFSDIVMNPAFMDAEVARTKSQIVAQQQKKVDDPSTYANDAFDAFLFQGHPYANDVTGTPKSIRKIKKQDVIRHFLTQYRPNNAMLAVVGRFNKDFEVKVAESFKKWAAKPIKEFSAPEPKAISGMEVKLLSKPGLQQAQIRIGEIGMRRIDENFLKLRLANIALGGEFGSRLNQRVRDDLGLTYSIFSSFDSRADRGPFIISTFTKNETVGQTLDESLKVFTDFTEQGMNEGEFKAAKEQLLSQFPRAIETADRLAQNILILNYYGVPVSYLQEFNKNVEALTLEQVNAAMKSKLDAKNLRILIYADQRKVLSQLTKYKPVVERAK
ncbi:MAG: insulinase family protein [Bdellovibrionaceae bacterium]|nr:insulinase family protein [Pseudobdellovibrionaceae bacterium]